MRHSGLALLSVAAIGLTVAAAPASAQTFNGYVNQDPAVTQSYAPFEGNNGYYGGYNYGPPVIGPVVGMVAAPFGGFAQANPGCFLDRDFNGRYTAMCGL